MAFLPFFAKCVVGISIFYLLVMGVLAMGRPRMVWPFLSSFASTPRANAIEAVLRTLAGAGFFIEADSFRFPLVFAVFGAFLAVSGIAMLFLFRLHHSFAQKVVPPLKPLMRLYGLGSFVLGVAIWQLWSPAS